MSHFTVAVFTEYGSEDEVEVALEPFCESTEDPAYLEFSSYGKITNELMEEYDCSTRDKLIKSLIDEGYIVDGDQYGILANPNAKWDWWDIGGRWTNLLRIIGKPERVNTVRISDWDTTPDIQEYNHARRFWEVVVDGQKLRDGETEEMFDSFWNKEYYKDHYGTIETYCECQSMDYVPFAAIDLEGNWLEKGEMGWFGFDTSTKESLHEFREWFLNYVRKLKIERPYTHVTMVDCHI